MIAVSVANNLVPEGSTVAANVVPKNALIAVPTSFDFRPLQLVIHKYLKRQPKPRTTSSCQFSDARRFCLAILCRLKKSDINAVLAWLFTSHPEIKQDKTRVYV